MSINKLPGIVLGIIITLSITFVLSLYVTSVAAQNQSSSTSASTASTTDITIPQGASARSVKEYYMPVSASVPNDTSITWTNKDIAPHTATADDGSFDAGTINPGSTASAMVSGQGNIPYHCNIHPWMHGSLQVSS